MTKTLLPIAVCLGLTATSFAGVVMSLTTNTASGLAGTISWDRSDAPFGTASAGSLLFNAATPTNTLAALTTEPILFENFPELAADQNISIVDFDAGFFELESFTLGAGTMPPPPSVGPTSLTDTGSYTNGFSGGTVAYDLRVISWPASDTATRSVSFNLSTTAVPEPSSFLALGLIAMLGGARRYFRRGVI